MIKILRIAAGMQEAGILIARWGIVIVLLWIGGLKAFRYEAVGIVPFVAHSPLMNFFYKYDAPEYKTHMNKEGEYIAENIKWHTENNTYLFSYGLGAVICIIGLMIAVYPVWPGVSCIRELTGLYYVTGDTFFFDHNSIKPGCLTWGMPNMVSLI